MKRIREKLGWTQKELARKSGISVNCIIDYETGKFQPNAQTILKFILATDAQPAYLFGLNEDKRCHLPPETRAGLRATYVKMRMFSKTLNDMVNELSELIKEYNV